MENPINSNHHHKGGFMMAEMPNRDVTGKCEGECEDRVAEMEKNQQKKIDEKGMERSTAETPSVDDAKNRKNPPGELGGHV
jgi:hypothetical protein